MQKEKVEMSYFNTLCPHDIPMFCRFHPGTLRPRCNMDYYEFCVITGSYRRIYKNHTHILSTGTLLFLRPGETHTLLENSPTSHFYSFIIKSSYFTDYCRRNVARPEQFLTTTYIEKELPSVQFSYFSYLADSIVYSDITKSVPHMEHFLSNMIFACSLSIIHPSEFTSSTCAKDLLQRMNGYQLLNIDVAQIYEYYPLSQTALINDFKKLTGYTIVQYRNIKRMELAADMLVRTNYSVTAIANSLNISSLGYFSQQFKAQHGMTPKEYQNMHRANKAASLHE